MKSMRRDYFVLGFALFAMFFGAGNLIFPPYLGFNTSSKWPVGFFAYILTDLGLSLLALLVIAKKGEGAEGITNVVGKRCSTALIFATVLCLGPLIAIPRTAATTFEFSVEPFFGLNSWIAGFIFFMIVALLCFKKSHLMDIIGTILSPVMFAALLILIVKGIISPIDEASLCNIGTGAVFSDGIKAGYQTMDMMGAILFSVTVMSTVVSKGYVDKNEQCRVITVSGCISAFALFLVYGGLAYLGASASSSFPAGISQSHLLIGITNALMGRSGVVILGIIVAFACITTAMGLVSASAEYFYELSRKKLPYSFYVVLVCLLSWILSNFGLSNIISIAAPILDLIYPVLLVLCVMALFYEKIRNRNLYKMASLGAFITSLLTVSENLFGFPHISHLLPLSEAGFGWLVPTVIFALIGYFMKDKN